MTITADNAWEIMALADAYAEAVATVRLWRSAATAIPYVPMLQAELQKASGAADLARAELRAKLDVLVAIP